MHRTLAFAVFMLRDFIKTLGSSKIWKKNILIDFKGRNFCWEQDREVKISQNFRDKLSQMTSNDAFRENLTSANDLFRWLKLIFLGILKQICLSSWPLKFISLGINFRDIYENIFHGSNFLRICPKLAKIAKLFTHKTFSP